MILQRVRYKDLESWSVKFLINNAFLNSKFPLKKLGDILQPVNDVIEKTEYNGKFEIVKKISFDKEKIELRSEKKTGMDLYKVYSDNLLISNINFHQGAVAFNRFNKVIVSSTHYQPYNVNFNLVLKDYLILVLKSRKYKKYINLKKTEGIKTELKFKHIKDFKIPLPDINTQKKLIEKYKKIQQKLRELKEEYPKLLREFEKNLFIVKYSQNKSLLRRVKYKDLENWSVKSILGEGINYNPTYPLVKLGEILTRDKTQIEIQDNTEYKRVTIKLYNGGIFLRDKKLGKEIGTKKQFVIKKGQFLLSKIDARNGAFGIVQDELDGAIVTSDFLAFDFTKKMYPEYLSFLVSTKSFSKLVEIQSKGTTGRKRVKENEFLNIKIPLPDISIQQKLVQSLKTNLEEQKHLEKELKNVLEEFEREIFE